MSEGKDEQGRGQPQQGAQPPKPAQAQPDPELDNLVGKADPGIYAPRWLRRLLGGGVEEERITSR